MEDNKIKEKIALNLEISSRRFFCIKCFKTKYLSMMIFKDHGNLRYKFENSNFEATSYYVSTVGLNEEAVRKYMRGSYNIIKI